MSLMDEHYARSVKSGLMPQKISIQTKSYLPFVFSCSVSCGP
ncbi:hypothetical protein T09_5200 [Trichinella sp. T9]|nr:hypothetical protein T09_5200 [Trichinella sp. T9]